MTSEPMSLRRHSSVARSSQFTPDSPVEEAGFEPLVPLDIDAARARQMSGNPCGARLGTTPFSERD